MSANGVLKNSSSDIYSNSPPTPTPPSPYRVTLMSKETELRKLKGELQENKLNVSYLESDLKTKDTQLERKDKLISKLKKEINQLRNVQQDVEELKQFHEKSMKQEEELRKLKDKMKELTSAQDVIIHLEEENSGLIQENETLWTKIKQLENKASEQFDLTELIEVQKMKIAALEEDNKIKTQLLTEAEQLKEDNTRHVSQIHQMYKDRINFLEENVAQLDKSGEILSEACIELQVQELKCELDEVKSQRDQQVDDLNQEMCQLQEKNDDLKNELKCQEVDYQSQLEQLKVDLKNAITEKDHLKALIHTEKENYRIVKENHCRTVAELESTLKLCQTETENLKTRVQNTITQIDKTTDERDRLKDEINSVNKQLEKNKMEYEKRIRQLQQKLSNVSDERSNILRHLNLLKDQRKVVREQMQAQQNEMDQRLTAFEHYLTQLTNTVKLMESEKIANEDTLRQVEQTAKELSETLEKKKLEVIDLKTMLVESEHENKGLKKNVNQLSNNMEDLEMSIETLTAKAREREKNLQNNLESSLKEIESLRAKVKGFNNDKKDFERKFQVMIKEKAKLAQEITSQKELLQAKDVETKKINKAKDKMRRQNLNFERIIKEKERELVKVSETLAVCEESTKKIVNELLEQLTHMKKLNGVLENRVVALEGTCLARISGLVSKIEDQEAQEKTLLEFNRKIKEYADESARQTKEMISQLEQKLKDSKCRLKELESWITQLQGEIDMKEIQFSLLIKEKEEETVRQKSELAVVCQRLDNLSEENNFFTEQIEIDLNCLKTSLQETEVRLKGALIEVKEVKVAKENSERILKETESELCEMKKELAATKLKLEEDSSRNSNLISTLTNEKEEKQKDIDEWITKVNQFESEMKLLKNEEAILKEKVKTLENKETKLIIENSRLAREQHTLGLKHELELSEKMEFFRNMWETEKSAVLLQLECKTKEIEELKLKNSENMKKESLKCAILQQELSNLQEKYERAKAMVSSDLENLDVLKEKSEKLKQHYEEQKQKYSELLELLQKEKTKTSSLETAIEDLQTKNMSMQRRFTEYSNNLKLRPFDVYASSKSLGELSPMENQELNVTRTVEVKEVPAKQFLTSSKLSLKSNEKFDDSLDDLNTVALSPFPLHSSSHHIAASTNNLAEVTCNRFNTDQNWLSTENENLIFDEKYLSNLKEGCCEVEFGRLTELQRRNTLCQPHLKTCYPIEMQMVTSSEIDDDGLKSQGRKSLGAPPVSTKSPTKRKVKNFRTSFRKPDALFVRKNVQFSNQNTSRMQIKTPSSIKRLFQTRQTYKTNSRQEDLPKNTSFSIGFTPKQKKFRRRLLTSPSSKETSEESKTKSPRQLSKLKIFSKPFSHRNSKNDDLLL